MVKKLHASDCDWTVQAYAGFELILRNDIEDYYSDLSVRDIIDLIQRDVSIIILLWTVHL